MCAVATCIARCGGGGAQAADIPSDPTCWDGSDDTTLIQQAITAGECLPPGTFHVDVPAPDSSTNRRRDAMLVGARLCGTRADVTTIKFRGDAHALYLVGMFVTDHGVVHDITLDTTCVTNTIEQTHLVHMGIATDAVAIHDNVFIHPSRIDGSSAGDCINIVGSAMVPNAGMTIDHNVFTRCARVGIQISRGVANGVIADNTFIDCKQDVGSQGAGGITNLSIVHNHAIWSGAPRGYSFALEQITGLSFDHNDVNQRPLLLYYCENCELTTNSFTNLVPNWPAIVVGDSAHHTQITRGNLIVQTADAPAIRVAPLGVDHQANLGDVTVDGALIDQEGSGGFVEAAGVAGITLSNSRLTYTGPAGVVPKPLYATTSSAAPPVTPVPSTGVVEVANVHVGFP